MRFARGDVIKHRANGEIVGVIVLRSPNESKYMVHWYDRKSNHIHTQEFIEEYYELEV